MLHPGRVIESIVAGGTEFFSLLGAELGFLGPKQKSLPFRLPREPSFLLLVLDNLGDAVLTTPFLELLKERLPQAKVTVLAKPLVAPLFEGHPAVDRVWTEEAPWWSPSHPLLRSLRPKYLLSLWRNIRRIRKERFDVVMDLRGDFRHLLFFGGFTRPGILLGASTTGGKALLSAWVKGAEEGHEVSRKLALLSTIGMGTTQGVPPVRVPLSEEERRAGREEVARALGREEGPFLVLDPGGSPLQRWPAERFGELAREVAPFSGGSVLLSSGPGMEPLVERALRVGGGKACRTLGPAEDTRKLAWRLGGADLLVSADTGAAMLAAAVDTPTVTLFGPTDPERFFVGKGPSKAVLSRESCRLEEPHRECRKRPGVTPGLCMEAITVEEVARAVRDVLGKIAGGETGK